MLGFQGAGFGVQGAGFRVQGSGFRVQGAGRRVKGSECRVQGAGCRVRDNALAGPAPPRYRGTSLIRNRPPPGTTIGH